MCDRHDNSTGNDIGNAHTHSLSLTLYRQIFDEKGEQSLYELALKDALDAPEDGARPPSSCSLSLAPL